MVRVRYREVIRDGVLTIEEIHRVIVHRFSMPSIEDHVITAAEPLYQWENSEAGKFIKTNSIDKPTWHHSLSLTGWEVDYVVIAELEKKKYSEFLMRFGENGNH